MVELVKENTTSQAAESQYMTGRSVKSILMRLANSVPGGHIVHNLMDEEHFHRKGPVVSDITGRKQRMQGNASNWFDDHYFINKDSIAIFWQKWLPEKEPLGVIVLVHGLGEHSGRYHHLATQLVEAGYAVYALDHQGSGRSEGERFYVKFFQDFVDDVLHLTNIAKEEHPSVKKTFLVGHSMGSLISLHTVYKAPKVFDGVILSSPPLKVDLPPLADKVAPLLATFFPKLPAPGLDIQTLTRDESTLDRYMNDPLMYHDYSPKLRMMNELVNAIGQVEVGENQISTPYLLMHGTADKICQIEGSEKFHNSVDLPDEFKTFVKFEGGFHELFNEPDAEQNAIHHAISWLKEH